MHLLSIMLLLSIVTCFLLAVCPTECTWDVFAFVLKTSPSVYRNFDWDKLTTITLVGFTDLGLIRFAHSKGVAVQYIASIDKELLGNSTYRAGWVATQIAFAKDHLLDGVNLDFEEPLKSGSEGAKGYLSMIKDVTVAFHEKIPGSQVSVDVAWSPDCIDGRCYDYREIGTVADKLFGMYHTLLYARFFVAIKL